MLPQALHITFTLVVIGLTIVVLVLDRIKPSLVFLLSVILLMAGGVLSVDTFVTGLSNTSILSIFLLIVITAAVNEYFNPSVFFDRLFKNTNSQTGFIVKMSTGVAAVSSFMNNTPVVAMMMPYVYSWGKKHNISPSKLLMPLSFAAIAGGVITLIGTSTNLVLNGLLLANNQTPLTFSDFFIPGLLITVISVVFLGLVSPRLLTARKDILDKFEENKREYLVEVRLDKKGVIVGKTIEEAGLRNLESAFITSIIRDGRQIVPVRPDEVLEAEDVLLFAGETTSIMNVLNQGTGLEPGNKSRFDLPDDTQMLEAVVSQNSGLDRRTVKEIGFREKYDAAIIGIHRRGERLNGKIGSIDLRTGDLLLLASGYEFDERNKRHEDLIVINKIERLKELSPVKRGFFWLGTLAAIVSAIFGAIGLFEALLAIVVVQGFAGMVNLNSLKRNISFDLLVILVSSLSVGQALISSGASEYLMGLLFANAASWSPIALIALVFGTTFILTSLITNVAAISIVFPVVLSLAAATELPSSLLFVTAAFAASCCFATPFAYQTNLMVMELGNYRFSDYVKLGLPLSILYAIVFITYEAVHYNLI